MYEDCTHRPEVGLSSDAAEPLFRMTRVALAALVLNIVYGIAAPGPGLACTFRETSPGIAALVRIFKFREVPRTLPSRQGEHDVMVFDCISTYFVVI